MIKKKKILAIVPARANSKGIKNKNIIKLKNKPLIYWPIKALKNSKYVDEVIVSTDSEKIKKIAKKFGAKVPFIRPKKLATNTAKSFDVVKHAINFNLKKGKKFDYVLLAEPTSPLTTSIDIDKAIELLEKKSLTADSITSVAETVNANPFFSVKLSRYQLLKPYLKKFHDERRQDIPKVFYFTGNFYISKVKSLLEYKSFYQKKTLGVVSEKWKALEIDDIYDLISAEAIMKLKNFK